MREYPLVFLVAAAMTYLLTVIAREIAIRTGATAAVRDRDVHDEPIPYLGGLAMLGGLIAAYLVARQLPFLSQSDTDVFRDAGVVLIAGAMICAVGVLDDIFELDALTKFGGQLLAAGFLVYKSIQFTYFIKPDGGQFSLEPTQAALLTVFVVVGDHERRQLRRRARRPGGGRGGDRGARLLRVLLPAGQPQQGLAGDHRRPAQRDARRRLCRVPAAQRPPRPAVHGRQRLDAARSVPGRVRDHPDRPVPPVLAQNGAFGSDASLVPMLLPLALPISISDAPAGRPGAGGVPSHPRRPVAVRPRQAAPAPPDAGDRATPTAGRS